MAAVVKTVDALALASVKSFNGLVAANLKTINGQDASTVTVPAITNAWKNTAAATSVAVTVAVTSGRACVVAVIGNNGSNANHTVTDNIDGATGWNAIRGPNTFTTKTTLWYKFSMSASVTTITCTAGTSALNTTGVVHEVSNVSAFTGGESNSAAAGGSNNPQTGTATNATANSIYFAALGQGVVGVGTQTINSTGTTGTWNLYSTNSEQNAAATQCASVVNLVVSTGAARGHGWTVATFPTTEEVVLILH